ncbi:MAG: sugar-transfer associated ATP-grasp domain-containing protein [Pacificimonas sp.]
MLRLKFARNIGPRYYLITGLNGRQVPWSDVAGHVNEAEYLAFIARMNPPEGRRPLDDKAEQKRRLLTADIPTPVPVFTMSAGSREQGQPFADAVLASGADRLAVKPLSGFGGRGFQSFRIAIQNGFAVLIDDADHAEIAANELPHLLADGFVAEPYLVQHDWYAARNADSVNTWRIWVVDAGGGPEVILAYLRMGRAGRRIDNLTNGGLYAPVDDDGVLGAGGDGTILQTVYAKHPDSGTTLAGERPPFFDEAKALARATLAALPELKFAGVDVAVTPNGPTVIEVNPEPDRMGAARVRLPFATWIAERGL